MPEEDPDNLAAGFQSLQIVSERDCGVISFYPKIVSYKNVSSFLVLVTLA
jgi:hypothetical protein